MTSNLLDWICVAPDAPAADIFWPIAMLTGAMLDGRRTAPRPGFPAYTLPARILHCNAHELPTAHRATGAPSGLQAICHPIAVYRDLSVVAAEQAAEALRKAGHSVRDLQDILYARVCATPGTAKARMKPQTATAHDETIRKLVEFGLSPALSIELVLWLYEADFAVDSASTAPAPRLRNWREGLRSSPPVAADVLTIIDLDPRKGDGSQFWVEILPRHADRVPGESRAMHIS